MITMKTLPADLPRDQDGHPILLECPYFRVIAQGTYFVITEQFLVNAAVMIAQNDKGEFLVASHNRPAIGKISIEFPRGGREPEDESTSITAHRELKEETGYSAEFIQRVGSLHSNSSLIRSSLDVFLLTGLNVTENKTDGEIDSMRFVSRTELNQMILNGDVTDAHTLSALALLDVFVAHQNAQKGNDL
jgi:ADP-ribose pyrophosphatase